MEKEQELINKNLYLIHNSKYSFGKHELVDLKGKTSHGGFVIEMVAILDSYGLIIENGHNIILSKFGKEVINKHGGWVEYLNCESIKEEKEDIIQNKKDWILNIDVKWKIPSIITGILVLFGTFYFGFKGITSKENKENIEYQKEKIKDTTSIKDLTKEVKPQTQLKDTLEFQIKDSK
jgi:hypothetical protein